MRAPLRHVHSPKPPSWLCAVPAFALALCLSAPARAGEPPDAPERRAALHALDVAVRRDAAVYLGKFGEAGSVPALLEALHDPEPGVRILSENAIWNIWMRSGDPGVDEQMRNGAELLRMQHFGDALEIFEAVVQVRPDFAEGYNKRATALFYLGDYERSLADIAETLKRNGYHFGALSGAGLCWMALGDPAAALPYFERALELNPNMPSVSQTIRELKQRKKSRTL